MLRFPRIPTTCSKRHTLNSPLASYAHTLAQFKLRPAMAGSGPSVGVTFLALVATLCISVVMGNMTRRNRACCDNERRTCKQDDNLKSTKNGRCRCGEATVDRGAGMDRRAPENEPVFSLYGGDGGDNDTEPRAPPMKLSASVLALLESFDVDPVRGKLGVLATIGHFLHSRIPRAVSRFHFVTNN